jgi:energy-coupling factor transporter ATP-binding protein EcfA2
MTALSLNDIRFSYNGQRQILDGVSIAVDEGDIAAITGASGCGKSTLAMIACGVIPKAVYGEFSGRVCVFGEDIADKEIFETAEQISMVFQDPEGQLFAPAACDEVAFGPENLCYDIDRINRSIDAALATVGMQDFYDRAPTRMSGGQQQLIALASILSLDPKIIILDEVAAQIDESGAERLKEAVRVLKQQGKTVIIIEHGSVFESLYDTAYLIENGTARRV